MAQKKFLAQCLLLKESGDDEKRGIYIMRRRSSHKAFIDELKKTIRSLKMMKPGEVHVLSVNANYGHYQIVIGAENTSKNKMDHSRPIEISGEIHHLFVSPKGVRAQPTKEQMNHNLKDTVIMRELSIHISDPKGDGKHLSDSNNDVYAREYINLAGDDGDKMAENMTHDPKMTMAAYRIVQEDILHSLKENMEETTD